MLKNSRPGNRLAKLSRRGKFDARTHRQSLQPPVAEGQRRPTLTSARAPEVTELRLRRTRLWASPSTEPENHAHLFQLNELPRNFSLTNWSRYWLRDTCHSPKGSANGRNHTQQSRKTKRSQSTLTPGCSNLSPLHKEKRCRIPHARTALAAKK